MNADEERQAIAKAKLVLACGCGAVVMMAAALIAAALGWKG